MLSFASIQAHIHIHTVAFMQFGRPKNTEEKLVYNAIHYTYTRIPNAETQTEPTIICCNKRANKETKYIYRIVFYHQCFSHSMYELEIGSTVKANNIKSSSSSSSNTTIITITISIIIAKTKRTKRKQQQQQ